jgi:anti-sigma factor RsiW
MHENMHALLNAYLDGELHGKNLQGLKSHLTTCEDCRKELKELRRLSELLKAAPAPDFMPAERFAANLALSLPRRNLRQAPSKPVSLAGWLVPTGILGAWFFVQTLFTLSGALDVLQSSGLLGMAASNLGVGQETLWFATATSLFGGQAAGAQNVLAWLNSLNVISVNLLEWFLWQALIALVYWGWLAVWWLLRRPRPVTKATAS